MHRMIVHGVFHRKVDVEDNDHDTCLRTGVKALRPATLVDAWRERDARG